MPVDPDKRKIRELKRTLKKAGNKHRRRALQRDLEKNPEEAAHSEEDLGGYSSEDFNGMDKDATRKKDDEPGE